MDQDVIESFNMWKRDITEFVVEPAVECRQSDYEQLTMEKLRRVVDRLKELFSALKMDDCLLMKQLSDMTFPQ